VVEAKSLKEPPPPARRRVVISCPQIEQVGRVGPLRREAVFGEWIPCGAQLFSKRLVAARLYHHTGSVDQLAHRTERIVEVILPPHHILLGNASQPIQIGAAPVAQYLRYGVVKVKGITCRDPAGNLLQAVAKAILPKSDHRLRSADCGQSIGVIVGVAYQIWLFKE